MKEGLEVLWVFGEDSGGEPYKPQAAKQFIKNTGIQFTVLLDDGFEQFMSAIDAGTSTLPQQFIIDPRTMELVDTVTGVDDPAWDKVRELIDRP